MFKQHVFREGNTRCQFVYFTQLAERAGYDLDFTQFGDGAELRNEFVNARYHHQATGTADRLATVIDKAIRPITAEQPLDRGPSIGALLAATRSTTAVRTSRPFVAPASAPSPGITRERGADRGIGD